MSGDVTRVMPARERPEDGIAGMLANGLLFNISWLAIVYSHSLILATAIAISHLAVHFALLGYGMIEARLVFDVSLIGFLLDQCFFSAGILTVAGESSFAPLWISCLWPVLATTLMHLFSGLGRRPVLACAVGAVGGAGSYMLGTRLSEVEFASPFWGPIIMALNWAIIFPSLLAAAASHGFDQRDPN